MCVLGGTHVFCVQRNQARQLGCGYKAWPADCKYLTEASDSWKEPHAHSERSFQESLEPLSVALSDTEKL